MVRRPAHYVDRFFRGANPGELAVEQPPKFWFGINVTTAKLFGLTIPRSVLLRADTLID